MTVLALRIRQLRKKNHLTQEALADKLRKQFNIKTDRPTVSRWETDKQVPEMYAISCLAKIFNVTIDYLNGTDCNAIYTIDNAIPLPDVRSVPLVGDIACGEPILAEENIENYVNAPESSNADFALKCKGDSMINARIFDGDIVFIRQQPTVENGQIAAVRIGNEATLKRVYLYDNRVELRPENPLFKVINLEGSDLEDFQILGKAVGFYSKII